MSLPGLEWFVYTTALIAGQKLRAELLGDLRGRFEWHLSDAAFATFSKRLEREGLIRRSTTDGGSQYELTRAGFDFWQEQRPFFAALGTICQEAEGAAERASFKPASRFKKGEVRKERLPNVVEVASIQEHASPAFRLLYGVAYESRRNVYDIAAALIQDIDWNSRTMWLPTKAVTGTVIQDRKVPLNSRSEPQVRTSIGERRRGEVFQTSQSLPWNQYSIGYHFRAARRAAGLPDEIVLSGRGRYAT